MTDNPANTGTPTPAPVGQRDQLRKLREEIRGLREHLNALKAEEEKSERPLEVKARIHESRMKLKAAVEQLKKLVGDRAAKAEE